MYDESVPSGIEAGSVDYWKFRARQWQKRCLRAEREKTELIAEMNQAAANLAAVTADKQGYAAAVALGDVQPTGRDYAPRLPKGFR